MPTHADLADRRHVGSHQARLEGSDLELISKGGWDAETPLLVLQPRPTPTHLFYTRSVFGVPEIDIDSYAVAVGGLVGAPRTFALDELRALGETTQVVTVECAGNGRTHMDPVPEGVPWDFGGVSVGDFTGVPLRRVLEEVAPSRGVEEFVFTGADRGVIDEVGELPFEFSLEAEVALGDGPLLVWGMNGGPLPPEHGGPLRLLVPDYYGMVSVKWLTQISAVGEAYGGYFRERYRFFDHPDVADGSKVDRVWVRSLITSPEDGATSARDLEVRGVAWSGHGQIASVAVQVDDGDWLPADQAAIESEHGPVSWSARLSLDPGGHVIAARAADEAGYIQPLTAPWNRLGYANNVVHRVTVTVS